MGQLTDKHASLAVRLGAIAGLMGLASGYVNAAPTVTSVTGEPVGGGQIIINGEGFGAKATALPLVFDNFESGSTGSKIAGQSPTVSGLSPNWTWREYRSGANSPQYSDQVTRPNSALSSRHAYAGSNGYNVSLEILYDVLDSGGEVYFSFWRYQRRTSPGWSRNVKPWMVYGSDGGTFPETYIGWGNPDDGDGGLRNAVIDSNGSTDSTIWGGTDIRTMEGKWVRMEVYLKQSSPGANDGSHQVWVHTGGDAPMITLPISDTTYRTRNSSNYWRQFHFGSYYATSPGSAASEVYLDDIYFDRTQARVELGDAPRWEDCTRREIQLPTSWSSNRISVNLNPGSFAVGQVAYLYVVNDQGVANTHGYRVTLGEGFGGKVPTSPTNVAVQ